MINSKFLKDIYTEARPIIERHLDDAELLAGLREVVAAQGGDWSSLKALITADVKDGRDEAGGGKRVQKILDKADYSAAYADMLGFANVTENNFSADTDTADQLERLIGAVKVAGPRVADVKAVLADETFDPATGEILETELPETANNLPAQEGGGNETCSESEPLGKSKAARPASVDAHVNDGGLAGQANNEVVTAGREPAPSPQIPSFLLRKQPEALAAE